MEPERKCCRILQSWVRRLETKVTDSFRRVGKKKNPDPSPSLDCCELFNEPGQGCGKGLDRFNFFGVVEIDSHEAMKVAVTHMSSDGCCK